MAEVIVGLKQTQVTENIAAAAVAAIVARRIVAAATVVRKTNLT